MAPIATTNSKTYRVGSQGNTSRAVGLIKDEYGVDIARLGHMSKEEVRRLGMAAKDAKQQAEFAKVALSHIENIVQHRNEINRLRGEAIDKGLKGKESVDKYVLDAMLKTHGHEAHIKEIFQKMNHGMGLIDAKSDSQLRLGENAFQNKLRELSAGHNSQLQGQREQSRMAIGSIADGQRLQKAEQRKRKGLLEFIRADDYQPNGSGGRGGWFGNWFS